MHFATLLIYYYRYFVYHSTDFVYGRCHARVL